MKPALRRRVACGALWIFAMSRPSGAAALEWQPILSLELLGGQSYFEGNSSSFGGNGSLLFSPALLFSPRLSVVPAYAGNYRRTRQVAELAGGAFLTQESQSHLVTIKGIYKLTPEWQAKAKTSYEREFVLETADETWGNGLFDTEKIALGLEAERSGSVVRSLRFAFDLYRYRFPNFKSLSTTQNFGSEINAGTDTLDFGALDPSVTLDILVFKDILLTLQGLVSYQRFGDANLVQSDGLYVDRKRRDINTTLGSAVQIALPQFLLKSLPVETGVAVNTSFKLAESNQNSYDASLQHFTPDYYDYKEAGIGPSVSFFLGSKARLGLGYSYTRRWYSDRLIQDQDGNFTSNAKIHTTSQLIDYSFSCALTKNFDLTFQGSSLFADSNMGYEATYQYKYSATHFLAGFGYHF